MNAARLGDFHNCPMVSPNGVPHVGGPIIQSSGTTVMIEGIPAACAGDMCCCAGPPDTIAIGSTSVLIQGKPAARAGDITAHGGSIIVGSPTVLIGG